MHSLVQPNAWAVLRLPSGNLRLLQVTPNTTISLGKYGSFPTNLIIDRPYHLTYELLDRQPNENFNRLRIVPAAELYSDILSSADISNTSEDATPVPEAEGAENVTPTGVEYSLVDSDSGAVLATTNRSEMEGNVRQTLTLEEIEAMKKDGTDAGRDLIAKLMLSHTAIEQKTEYSLAKYKLLKTRKYIRRFSILPLDVPMLDYWTLEEKDASKIMDMREEMLPLLGCWANVHFGGTDACETTPVTTTENGGEDTIMEEPQEVKPSAPGRWLVVDDTGGLLVAAMAERMGILYPSETNKSNKEQQGNKTHPNPDQGGDALGEAKPIKRENEEPVQPVVDQAKHIKRENEEPWQPVVDQAKHIKRENEEPLQPVVDQVQQNVDEEVIPKTEETTQATSPQTTRKHRRDEALIPYAYANTITHIHPNAQPNLSYLRYFDFDITSPTGNSSHPLASHLMTLSWLQLLEPELDGAYNAEPPTATPEEIYSWKTNRRSAFHRKRKRWARTRHIIDTTRKGGFSGLVVASTMDPISIMRHAVPLLAGGAPIAIYSQSVEALTELADCYSVGRRAAWALNLPEELAGKSLEEQENWAGNEEFPLNPSLVLGASIQTSRVRKWQVLPGRTHPLMSSRGGAEGYIFTAWRVKPAEGKVEARGNLRSRKRTKVDEPTAA